MELETLCQDLQELAGSHLLLQSYSPTPTSSSQISHPHWAPPLHMVSPFSYFCALCKYLFSVLPRAPLSCDPLFLPGQLVCIFPMELALSPSIQRKRNLVLSGHTSLTVLSFEAEMLEVRYRRKQGGKDGFQIFGREPRKM